VLYPLSYGAIWLRVPVGSSTPPCWPVRARYAPDKPPNDAHSRPALHTVSASQGGWASLTRVLKKI
jgi:hypothetical protein